MFNLAAALAHHNGEYSFADLQNLLRQFRREHLGDLSPEVDSSDLLRIATEHHWITEDDAGLFHIHVPRAA
jgi:hypothetical protein